MFCNFYLVKTYKIAKNSTTTKAREKISTDLESLEFQKFLMYGGLNLKTIKFYVTKLATDFYGKLLGETSPLLSFGTKLYVTLENTEISVV
jgi:hypothetical protein